MSEKELKSSSSPGQIETQRTTTTAEPLKGHAEYKFNEKGDFVLVVTAEQIAQAMKEMNKGVWEENQKLKEENEELKKQNQELRRKIEEMEKSLKEAKEAEEKLNRVRKILGEGSNKEGSDKGVIDEVNDMLRRIQNGELNLMDPGVNDRALKIRNEVEEMLIEELNRLSDRGLIEEMSKEDFQKLEGRESFIAVGPVNERGRLVVRGANIELIEAQKKLSILSRLKGLREEDGIGDLRIIKVGEGYYVREEK